MPTPFTHLAYAHRLLRDDTLPQPLQHTLHEHLPAFLLGSVAADARVDAPDSRAATHFYTYTEPMRDHPWRLMTTTHPLLQQPHDADQAAFVAGYVFHLAMDEIWSLDMLAPHFNSGVWGGSRAERFFMLHFLLMDMDERDHNILPTQDADLLPCAQPHDWLPFMSDAILSDWAGFIARQVVGESQTLRIFGGRIQQTPQQVRALLDDRPAMTARLYQFITPSFLAQFEERMYAFARQQLLIYAGFATE